MSNIFYTNVNKNLRIELNARGTAGKHRKTNSDLDFMLSKIANAKITAYEPEPDGSKSLPSTICKKFGVLGGSTVREGRYLPSGPEGYLRETSYTASYIDFYTEKDVQNNSAAIAGYAYAKQQILQDKSYRIGPYLSLVDVEIGDHSMGLLNRASINMIVPNPQRDLDDIEETWLRPGRYMTIDIEHPTSAIASYSQTAGLLEPEAALPKDDILRKLYPNWANRLDELKKNISRMNVFQFSGLITSFDFSYTSDGTVEISISVTGTSNVYTDISMFMTPDKSKQVKTPPEFEIDKDKSKEQIEQAKTSKKPLESQFFQSLNQYVEARETAYKTYIENQNPNQYLITWDDNLTTDQFILAGQPYPARPTSSFTYIDPPFTPNTSSRVLPARQQELYNSGSAKREQDAKKKWQSENKAQIEFQDFNRYITLGALIEFINKNVISGSLVSPVITGIVCSDTVVYSNYYSSLVSAVPDTVLLLPADPSNTATFPDMHCYGPLIYYQDVITTTEANFNANEKKFYKRWPGIYESTNNIGKIYPSRIFLNLELIQYVVKTISAGNSRKFTLSTFLSAISTEISTRVGGAIDLKLVSDSDDPQQLLFTDIKNIKNPKKPEIVIPYSVPMFANHPSGSIVQEFQFQAKLPENAKNLAYILNQGDDVTEEEIAPYVNFMYNSNNPALINKAIKNYATKFTKTIETLSEAKIKFGQTPQVEEVRDALKKALRQYVKYPTKDIKTSLQQAGPIFPFDVTFTIDGINGLRYGDVLIFEALPLRYRANTVFSIIGITQSVTVEGTWTTKVRCIMRPSIP